MTRAPTGTAGRYLDVVRTLGVPDATVRRHHGVAPDASLQAALAEGLSAPTDRLLEVLAGTGVVVDLADAATDDGTALATSLARFGFDVECTAVGDDVEVVTTDRLGDFVTHLRSEPDDASLRDALARRLLDESGIAAVALVDDRTLVADRTALAGLQERYGRRLEPFATPILGVDVPTFEAPPGATAGDAGRAPTVGVGDADGRPSPAADGALASDQAPPASDGAPPATGSAASAPGAQSGPAASERSEPVASAGSNATVSGSGIDDVFDEIESAAASERQAADDLSPDPFTRPLDASEEEREATRPSAGDPAGDPDGDRTGARAEGSGAAASSGASDGGPELAGGTPKRTVSETSADDILAQARGGADFEDVAAEREPDPDAVLDDAGAVDAVDDATGTADESAGDAGTGEPRGDGSGEAELTLSRGESSTDGPLADRGGLWSEASDGEDAGGLPDEIRSILGRGDEDRN